MILDNPGNVFSKKFEADIRFMHQSGHLPKMWDHLKEVKFVATSKGAEIWLEQAKPKIATSENGQYLLEFVLIDDSEPAKKTTVALVQMSIIDIKSGNKLWELARYYSLDNDENDNIFE
jgi:hypothetical protein